MFADAAQEASAWLASTGADASAEFAAMLLRLNEAAPHTHNAIRAALKLMPNNTDADEALSVLELADKAALEFCGAVYDLAGLALAVLEAAGSRTVAHPTPRFVALDQAGREVLALAQSAQAARKRGSGVDDPDLVVDSVLRRVELLGSCVGVLADCRIDPEEIGVQYQFVFGRELEADHG